MIQVTCIYMGVGIENLENLNAQSHLRSFKIENCIISSPSYISFA